MLLEAVLAAFLMTFAFATSAKLFDSAVRWESESTSARRASMIAERKIEEIRAATVKIPSGSNFNTVLQAHLGDSEYSDDPGFKVSVKILRNRHMKVESSGLLPDDGAHSPCVSMYTKSPVPTTNPPNVHRQFNSQYKTYPYTRHISKSLQLIEVSVGYGSGKKVTLLTLIGDPITPTDKTPKVIVTGGPNSLSNYSASATFTAQVITKSGSRPQDVTVLWNTTLESTGVLNCFPRDATGGTVDVYRSPLSPVGTSSVARLQALVRYGGQEAVGISAPIALP